ncbi:hypothetical protein A6A04_15010 [Paramagnetospirillum marisnigri]|uniref:Uncharacterized protein n=1 Tax=Paramagnetospirillum marisnigri TaxID=1285242 RepID=A0A178MVV4_9PROT|nr:hypothetical protein [Paramagnetospirillum marisnigri]OAN53023.1 hypothetical protein A6A04_15010 [Paramagnetospirillum marisnigri]
MTDSAELDRLRTDNAAMVKTLRAIDRAATEIETTDGPADDRAMWTAIYEARRLLANMAA